MDPSPDPSPATPQCPALEFGSHAYSAFPASLSSSSNGDGEEYESPEDKPTSITISITAPLHIKGSNNLLAVNLTSHATAIAHSVIQALKEASMSRAGIPMIDEDGRPRTLDVKVDAGIRVEGERNVVGEKAVAEILGGRNHSGVDELNGSKNGVHLRQESRKRAAGDEDDADEGAKRLKVV
jgi:hypothetical protein